MAMTQQHGLQKLTIFPFDEKFKVTIHGLLVHARQANEQRGIRKPGESKPVHSSLLGQTDRLTTINPSSIRTLFWKFNMMSSILVTYVPSENNFSD